MRAALALLLLAAPTTLTAQTVNPYEGDFLALRAGRAIFETGCARCHGADARGMSGPDLTNLWADGVDEGRIFDVVQNGIPGSIMPGLDRLDQEVWAVVAYVKGLGTVEPFDVGGGDPARGEEAFERSCSGCHRVAGNGGALGPDLTRIARVRSRAQLVESIREPGRSVARGYRPVVLTTAQGDRVRGAAKAEDAFSIQVMDLRQRLQGYAKRSLGSLDRPSGSLMPVYGADRLTDAEMNDLLSYLLSLAEATP